MTKSKGMGKALLIKRFHECKDSIDRRQNLDTLIVKVYQYYNGQLTKEESKEIALCLYYNYGFLYK